jgi:hypothetical protein
MGELVQQDTLGARWLWRASRRVVSVAIASTALHRPAGGRAHIRRGPASQNRTTPKAEDERRCIAINAMV